MKLWLKTVLIIGLSLAVAITLISVVVSTILLERFATYERDEAQRNLARATSVLWDTGKRIEGSAGSFSVWTEMYEYIANPYPEFIGTALNPDFRLGATPSDLNNIKDAGTYLFINAAGELVWGIHYDLYGTKRMIAPPTMLRAQVGPGSPLLQHANVNSSHIGILSLPDGDMLVASQPIVTSQKVGPIRGSVIAGHYLDSTLVAALENTMRLPVKLYSVHKPDLPADVQQALAQLQQSTTVQTPTLTLPLNEQTIASYALFADVAGNPAVILKVEQPRTIYQQGLTGVGYLLSALLLIGMLTGGGIIAVLHVFVVRRLAVLNQRVLQIRTSRDFTKTVPVSGNDEISHLTKSINSMLAALSALVTSHAAAQAAAEEANTIKSKFIANMSHELRTPLNAIINFTYIIRKGMRGPVTPEQVEYLDRVYANGEHLLGMINDILDLSKVEAGRMDLFREPVNLGELVSSTMASAVGLTKEKPITLHQDLAPDLPLVDVDKTRIRQVLLNLLSNAAKFTDAGQITVRVWGEGHELRVSVQDSGLGIAAEKFETIFTEFRQADEGSARSYQGTGLGLPISKRLIALHGGHLWVESQVGVGSTFTFSLPLPLRQAPDPPLSLPLPGTEQGPVVLVIDDDPAAIEIVRSYLQTDGYAVYGLSDSHASLAEVQRLQPAAILLDIVMPLANGWDILATLKRDPAVQHIPVIMYTVVEEVCRGMVLGADGYLVKPVDPQQLCATVERLVPARGTILVIDDDPQVLHIVQDLLQHADGYEVRTATSGQAGLAAIAAQRPDLVVLDLIMPEMDGFSVLVALDAEPATRSIPVVVVSAKTLTTEERSYLRTRVNRFVSKQETSPEHWLQEVRAVLQDQQR